MPDHSICGPAFLRATSSLFHFVTSLDKRAATAIGRRSYRGTPRRRRSRFERRRLIKVCQNFLRACSADCSRNAFHGIGCRTCLENRSAQEIVGGPALPCLNTCSRDRRLSAVHDPVYAAGAKRRNRTLYSRMQQVRPASHRDGRSKHPRRARANFAKVYPRFQDKYRDSGSARMTAVVGAAV